MVDNLLFGRIARKISNLVKKKNLDLDQYFIKISILDKIMLE